MTIDGAKQGKFKAEGGPQFKGRIPVHKYSVEVISPRDPASGQPTGKRLWKPVEIVKDWSAASPQIVQAIATNEVLTSVLIEIFRTEATGLEQLVGTVRLTNASVSSYHSYVSEGSQGDIPAGRAVESVQFTFQRIELTNPDGQTGVMDDWLR